MSSHHFDNSYFTNLTDLTNLTNLTDPTDPPNPTLFYVTLSYPSKRPDPINSMDNIAWHTQIALQRCSLWPRLHGRDTVAQRDSRNTAMPTLENTYSHFCDREQNTRETTKEVLQPFCNRFFAFCNLCILCPFFTLPSFCNSFLTSKERAKRAGTPLASALHPSSFHCHFAALHPSALHFPQSCVRRKPTNVR
jgi:hypothetical protein